MMRRWHGAAASLFLLLAGCQSAPETYTYLPPQGEDGSFKDLNITTRVRRVSNLTGIADITLTIPVRFKVFRRDDKLAICGYYLLSLESSCRVVFHRRWFDGAAFSVGDKLIGSGEFLERYSPRSDPSAYQAGCVVTKETWDDSLLTLPLTYKPAEETSAPCYYW